MNKYRYWILEYDDGEIANFDAPEPMTQLRVRRWLKDNTSDFTRIVQIIHSRRKNADSGNPRDGT